MLKKYSNIRRDRSLAAPAEIHTQASSIEVYQPALRKRIGRHLSLLAPDGTKGEKVAHINQLVALSRLGTSPRSIPSCATHAGGCLLRGDRRGIRAETRMAGQKNKLNPRQVTRESWKDEQRKQTTEKQTIHKRKTTAEDTHPPIDLVPRAESESQHGSYTDSLWLSVKPPPSNCCALPPT